MKKWLNKLTTLALIVSLLVGYPLSASTFAFAQLAPARQSDEHGKAIAALAEYFGASGDAVTRSLDSYGYKPPVPLPTWQRFPVIKKLEYACAAAETADPNGGGDRLLALLSQNLAQQYESVRHTPELRSFVGSQQTTRRIEFKNPPPGTIQVRPLPKKITRAIDKIAEYTAASPIGDPQSILVKHFDLTREQAYDVLRQSNSHAEAFKLALNNHVPKERRRVVIAKLANDVSQHYESVHYEPALKSYLLLPVVDTKPERRNGDDSTHPQGPLNSGPRTPQPKPDAPGGGNAFERPQPPERTQGTPDAGSRYGSFVEQNYKKPGSRIFRNMSVRSKGFGGFGGVVFGNDVTGDRKAPRLVAVSFENGTMAETVNIRCTFSDNSIAVYPDVRIEDAYAAYKIVVSGIESLPPLAKGEGVGLVGLDTEQRSPNVECQLTGFKLKEGVDFNIILHPALVDLDTGWAAIMGDALPIEREALLKSIEKTSGLSGRDAFDQLFKSLEYSSNVKDLGTWKVVDVPMTIRKEGQRIVVMRTAETNRHFPEGMRRTAFIEMRYLIEDSREPKKRGSSPSSAQPSDDDTSNSYDKDFAEAFYRLLPLLAKASYDYRRLNEFAAVLGVFRWAKQQSATFPRQPVLHPTRKPTPDAIRIFDGAIKPIASFDRLPALERAVQRVDVCMQDVENSPEVQEFDRMKEAIFTEIETQRQIIFRFTDPENLERKKAIEAKKEAEKRLAQLKLSPEYPSQAMKFRLALWLKRMEFNASIRYELRRRAELRERDR